MSKSVSREPLVTHIHHRWHNRLKHESVSEQEIYEDITHTNELRLVDDPHIRTWLNYVYTRYVSILNIELHRLGPYREERPRASEHCKPLANNPQENFESATQRTLNFQTLWPYRTDSVKDPSTVPSQMLASATSMRHIERRI